MKVEIKFNLGRDNLVQNVDTVLMPESISAESAVATKCAFPLRSMMLLFQQTVELNALERRQR